MIASMSLKVLSEDVKVAQTLTLTAMPTWTMCSLTTQNRGLTTATVGATITTGRTRWP